MTNTINPSPYYMDPSFFTSLLQANVQRVLDAAIPQPAACTAQPSKPLPSWLTGDELNTFLAELQPDIERAARSLYFRTRDAVNVDQADLEQVGMIAAWQASQRYDASKVVDTSSFHGYCMKFARGAMLAHLRGLHPTLSLDAETQTEDGAIHRELPTPELHISHINTAYRRRILAGLRKLSRLERLAVMARYRVADRAGYVPTDARSQSFRNARHRGLRKLANILGGPETARQG